MAGLTGGTGAYESRMGTKIGFFYSPITTKEPRLVTFARKVNLQKLGFFLFLGVKLALDFIVVLKIEKREGFVSRHKMAF